MRTGTDINLSWSASLHNPLLFAKKGVMSEEATKGEAEVSQQPSSDEKQEAEKSEDQTPETTKEDDEGKPKPEGGDAQSGEAEPPKEEEKEEKPQLSDPEEPDDGVPIALVTGASGYMASHIIKQLLEQGRFRVRGTVRSIENEKKVKPLRDLVADPKYPLRLIEADLLKPQNWTEAVRRCSYVFHVASPLMVSKPKNPDVVLKPAVEGTTNVLKACSEAGTVKRVVLTSSVVAVASMAGDPDKPRDHVYTEADWTNEANANTYEKSKVRAEKAAWDLVKNLDASKQFELVSVCPGLLVGPIFSESQKGGSVGLIVSIVTGKSSRLPDVHFLVADVRDVAAAHIAALEKPEAAGNRYIVFTDRLPMKQIAQILADEFKSQGYKISVRGMPKAAMWAAKLVSSEAKLMYPMVGKQLELSNDKMKGELGINPRPVKETLIDLGYNLIDLGIVAKKPGYLGHPSTRPPAAEPTTTESKEKASAEVASGQTQSKEEQQDESKPAEPAATSESVKAEEPVKQEEAPVEPAKEDEPPSEPVKQEEPPSEPVKDEEPPSEPVKQEEPPSEPVKDEEPPSEPVKDEKPPSEPVKDEEPPSEPVKDEKTPSEPVKDEEPPSEPVKDEEPPSEPVKDEEPPSEPVKDEEPPSEPVKDEEPPTEEPAQEEEPASQPVTEEPSVPDEEPPSQPAPQEDQPPSEADPPSEPTEDEQPSTADTPAAEQDEQQQSEPQDTPASDERSDEATKEADTES